VTGEEVLTIAEAAAQIGVNEPRLRRLLARPEYAGRVVSLTRRTRTGTRTGKAVPLAFLPELKVALDRISTPETQGERERERSREREREALKTPPDAMAIRVVEEQAARINDLRAQVANLQAQLDAANERQRGHKAALARALPPAPEAPNRSKDTRRPWWNWRRKDRP